MQKKIVFKILLSFAFITQAQSAESGGMPQLNPEFWVSQIVWLVITFGALYIVLSKVILPKISDNLEIRRSQILENIEVKDKSIINTPKCKKAINEANKIISKIAIFFIFKIFVIIKNKKTPEKQGFLKFK